MTKKLHPHVGYKCNNQLEILLKNLPDEKTLETFQTDLSDNFSSLNEHDRGSWVDEKTF